MEMRRHPIWGDYAQHLMGSFVPPKVCPALASNVASYSHVSAPSGLTRMSRQKQTRKIPLVRLEQVGSPS